MSGTVWSKWYWSDWESDPSLRLCSFAAQGLWMRMLCIAAAHDPVGYVAVNGRPVDGPGLARMTGGDLAEVAVLLTELEANGVCSRDRRGWLYSRRMIRDAKKAEVARQNGSRGGNPTLSKRSTNSASDNPQDNDRHNTHKPEARSQKVSNETSGAGEAVAVSPDDVKEAFDAWNRMAKLCGLPQAEKLTETRRRAIRTRLNENGGRPGWQRGLHAVARSPHCRGKNDRGWRADLDFMCQAAKFARLIEGSYGTGEVVPRGLDAAKPSAALTWAGPPEVRAAILEAKGQDWTGSWLDPCGWNDLPQPTVLCDRELTLKRLRQEVGPILASHGLRLALRRDLEEAA